MQSEELSDPDQDFQPNKRARVSAPPAPSMDACCQAVSYQDSLPLLGAVRGGKENLLPAKSVAPGSIRSQSLIDLSNEELEPDLLPVRKAKFLVPSAIKAHLPPAPAADQRPRPPVAVRAFFTRRQSWSTLERSKHPERTETLGDAVSAKLRPSDASQKTGSAAAELLPSYAACLDALSSAAVNAVSQVQPSEHGWRLAEPLPVQIQQPALTNSLSMPIAAAAAAASAEPSLESLPGDFIVLDSSASDADSDASDDAELADMQTQAEASHQAVVAWLHQHNLSAYTTAFKQAEVDLDFIPWLNDNDLKQMGVTALGPRRKLLAAAAKLAAKAAESTRLAEQSGCEHDAVPAECQLEPDIAGAADRQLVQGKDAFAVLMKQARQGQVTAANAGKAQKPTDALSMLMQQARGSHVSTAPEPSSSHQGGSKSASRGGPSRLPNWQMVPGTSFVVDKFGGKAYEAAPRTKHWFLTHFHADHYGGLGPRFKQGTIYCSPITARLVQQRLKVPAKYLHIVPLHSPFQVAGVTVTFIDAHHCPGAVMILFEAPGRLPLLHTGDCRCHQGMQEEQCLQRVRGAVDLVLDTTYCNPQYVFPRQEEVLEFVLNAVKAEAFNEKKTLFLFGSYTIGKEKLFLEVARNLKQKIYVSVAKRKVLECLELPAELAALLTSNDKETNLHAVPLWSITLKSMTRLLKHYRGRYTTIVGFQPTGWTQKQDRGKAGQGRRRHKGTLITYQVPYSEHSSFPEMRDFVGWLRPCQIIPSVGNDYNGPKAAHMVSLLRSSA